MKNELTIPKFRFGDHIKVRRWGGFYSHHGVYVGDSNVLHLTGDAKRGLPVLSYGKGLACVQIDNIKEFEYGGTSEIVKAATKDLDKSIFLQEVEKIVGQDKEYNLVLHNCEHFANEVTDHKVESKQIHSAWYATTIGGVSSMMCMYALHTMTGTLIVPIVVTGVSFWSMQYL